jgi:heme-degrading monooxygenase HmoA
MIARLWHGTTRAEDADRYHSYLETTGLRDYRTTPGNRGVTVLRTVKEGRAEFLLVTLWDSMEAIRGFAGADVNKAVYYPEDARFLLSMEPNVAHYEVLVPPPEAGLPPGPSHGRYASR